MATNPSRAKSSDFLNLSNLQWYCLWCLSGNPLDYDFPTHWYWLCNIDFPVILTQNGHGKRIIIAGLKCIQKMLTKHLTRKKINVAMVCRFCNVCISRKGRTYRKQFLCRFLILLYYQVVGRFSGTEHSLQ